MQFQSSQKTKGMELLPLSAALPPSLIAGGNSAAASLLLIAARISQRGVGVWGWGVERGVRGWALVGGVAS